MEIFNSIIDKNLENYQAGDSPRGGMWHLLASVSSNKIIPQLNQQLLVERQASEVIILENILFAIVN